MEIFLDNLISIIFIVIIIFRVLIKKVPKDTVYIIDKHTHYHKTVKNGYFFLNPISHTITTKISTNPITNTYSDVFETNDGKNLSLAFTVTYSAKNMEDVLYNLEKVRRSIDDILKGCMYSAMLSLNSTIISKESLSATFLSRLQTEAMSFGLDIHNFDIFVINTSSQYSTSKAFKPHKNYSDGKDPIQYV